MRRKDDDSDPAEMAAGKALQEQHYELAVDLYDSLIQKSGSHAEWLYKRANAFKGLGRLEAALSDYNGAIALDPTHSRAYCNRGAVLEQLSRLPEALSSYDMAVALDPADFISFYNRGSALKELERFDEALASYDHALALNHKYVPARVNRGNVLQKLRRYQAAIENYDTAIELNPGVAEAFLGRAVSLFNLRRFQDSLLDLERALLINSSYPEAHSNRGGVLQEMGDHEAALASFARALELNPKSAAALQGCGYSLLRLQRFDAAIESYNQAVSIEPERKYLAGIRRHAMMQVCDWRGLDRDLGKIAAALWEGKPVSAPFPILSLVDSSPLHQQVAKIWAINECPQLEPINRSASPAASDRIRVGYFSADFFEHPVSLLTAELFEKHDSTRFEITAFSFGPRSDDSTRARLRKAFGRFIDVRNTPDADVAQLARSCGIDIAVDLGGYTEHSRPGIFALRAAPLQVNYLGYPGSMGAAFMDYIIADRVVLPEEQKRYYTEKIIYLPNCYMPSDSSRTTAGAEVTREEAGLPSEGFVFCCFNNSFKIMPGVFESWMRILRRAENSVLWLSHNDDSTARNLRREAQLHGVDDRRLIFAHRVASRSAYLARLRAADLFLDTLPYNAHATANDVLWAGLPIITLCGESFPARVAASLLTAIGLSELITTSGEQYEDLAVQLASSPKLHSDVMIKLRRNSLHAPLFDMKLFCSHLESAYASIVMRHRAGSRPDHTRIDP